MASSCTSCGATRAAWRRSLDIVRSSVERYPTYPIWRAVLAQVTSELALDEASDHFTALARDGFSILPFDETWVVATGLLAEVASSLGHRAGAAILLQRLRPYADRVAVSTPEVSSGAVARCLGLLATTMEDGTTPAAISRRRSS